MSALRSPEAVLSAARQHGVSLLPDGDKLQMKAPKAPPPALVEAVREFKPELLRLLAVPPVEDWQTDDPHPARPAALLRNTPDPPAGLAGPIIGPLVRPVWTLGAPPQTSLRRTGKPRSRPRELSALNGLASSRP